MGFFETLKIRALLRAIKGGHAVDATIEALREMMVGEPSVVTMSYREPDPMFAHLEEGWAVGRLEFYHRGDDIADGEEVCILVVRTDGQA